MGAQEIGRVLRIRRYPVKSTAGEELEAAELDRRGLRHDRVWAAYLADGGIASGKTSRRFRKVPGLLGWRSELDPERALVTLVAPDGRRWAAGDPAASRALSDDLATPLQLRPEGEVAHFDDCGVHLVTTASLRTAARRAGGALDPGRLRMNLVLDTGDADGFLEAGWSGAELALGDEVVLRLGAGMPRCVMVDLPQHGVTDGPALLRALGGDREPDLGVMAEVVRAGTVRRGDRAVLAG